MSDTAPQPKRAGRYKHVNREQARKHERTAFEMKARGATHATIAAAMGLSTEAVRRILNRANTRAMKELTARHAHLKIQQNAQLEALIEEAFTAWGKSKEPLKRARQTTNAEGEEVTVHEAIEREGNPSYIDRVRGLLSDQRSLWGLDVAEQPHEASFTLSDASRDIQNRAERYQAEIQAEEAAARGETQPQQDGGPAA